MDSFAKVRVTPIFIALFLISTVMCSVAAAGEFNVGMISLRQVLTQSVKAQKAFAKFRTMSQEANNKVRLLQQEVKKLQGDLGKNKATLKPDEIAAKQKTIQSKQQELNNQQRSMGTQMEMQRRSMQNSLRLQLDQIVKQVAKKKGINIVLSEGSVLYSEGVPDLTKEVLQTLDAGETKAQPRGPAAGPVPGPPSTPAPAPKKK